MPFQWRRENYRTCSGRFYSSSIKNVELWRSLTRSAAIALHVSGDYPDLHFELWAIRGQSA